MHEFLKMFQLQAIVRWPLNGLEQISDVEFWMGPCMVQILGYDYDYFETLSIQLEHVPSLFA